MSRTTQIRYDSGGIFLEDADGWRFKLDGIYALELREGEIDYGFGLAQTHWDLKWVVTIPAIRTAEQLAVLSNTLRVLREEIPTDYPLVIETDN